MKHPESLEATKRYFIEEHNATLYSTLEADDCLGLNQTSETCIASIDKDLLMIPGWHYNFVKNEFTYIDEFTGIYNFYHQLLVGDPTDNIKGARGIGKAKAKGILEGCETEEQMLEAVEPYFSCYEELDLNASVLWIQRKGREKWNENIHHG